MQDDQITTPVLVVGGGVVGLTLAMELGWRGHECLVMDEGDGVISDPRTGGISIRTMEHARRWGISDRIRNCGFPENYRLGTVFCTSMDGFVLARADRPSMAETPVPPTSPERRQRCPQMWLDPILARAAKEHPTVSIEYGWRVESIRDDGDHVTAFALEPATGRRKTVLARYVVGCDGAASETRQALGIDLDGEPLLNYSVNVLFRAPGFLSELGVTEAERFVFVGPEGTWGNITVVDGDELWRLTVIGSTDRLNLESFDATAWIRRATGSKTLDVTILSVLPWRRSQLVARGFRQGRVFLAGDSAHTMSPTGGFGANTGIGDAVDLGWKLSGVLNGWAGDALLDSYPIERRQVAVRNGKAASGNFRGWLAKSDSDALMDDSPEGETVRRELGERLLAGTHAEWHSEGVILGYRYEESPVVVHDGSTYPDDDPATYTPSTNPGVRAPHVWLGDDRSVLDLFGRGFVLVRPAGASSAVTDGLPDAARRSGVPFAVVDLDESVSAVYGDSCVLVRPDGHIAWRDWPGSPSAEEVIATTTGRPVIVSVGG